MLRPQDLSGRSTSLCSWCSLAYEAANKRLQNSSPSSRAGRHLIYLVLAPEWCFELGQLSSAQHNHACKAERWHSAKLEKLSRWVHLVFAQLIRRFYHGTLESEATHASLVSRQSSSKTYLEVLLAYIESAIQFGRHADLRTRLHLSWA